VPLRVDKRSVLITGATGRVGSVLATGFAALGWDLALTTRRATSASGLEAECQSLGAGRVVVVEVDLEHAEASQELVNQLAAADFSTEVLINNARDRNYLRKQPSGIIGRSEWEGELRLGVIVPYELTIALAASSLSALRTVVNIASIYGVTPPTLAIYDSPGQSPPESYGATKAALIHLTKELAVRLAPRIQVNAVSYGGIKGRTTDDFVRRYEQICPGKRMLDDGDLFGVIRFLASHDAAAITGQNIIVDDGWTI